MVLQDKVQNKGSELQEVGASLCVCSEHCGWLWNEVVDGTGCQGSFCDLNIELGLT